MKSKMKMMKKENLKLALPHDLVVEILLSLPVRSLVRFKCVCKSWRSIISDPQFAKSHFDLAASPTHRLLLKRINHDSEIRSLDFEASLSAVVNLKFPPYRALSFLTLGSSRGLILLAKNTDPSSLGGLWNPLKDDLIVWNPSTGAHREIPVTNDSWDSWYDPSTQKIPPFGFLYGGLYGFGYDSSKDDYLLVIIRLGVFQHQVTKRIGVLSLKTNETSFYDDDVEDIDAIGAWSVSGLYLNQSLHWSVQSSVTDLYAVIAFDLVERSLSKIPLSPNLDQELSNYDGFYLSVLGGCLSISYLGTDRDDAHEMTEIWVMKEYKVQSSWTKSFVISINVMRFLPIWVTEGGEVLGSNDTGGLMKFNDQGELLENHPYGIEDEYALKYFDMYRESLLTLPGEGDFEEENEDA